MDNQIKSLINLNGKTIIDVKKHCDDLWLKFSDNTFAVLVINDITKGFGQTKTEIDLDEYSRDKTEYILVELGLISKQEYDEAIEQDKLEEEIYAKKREIEEKERIEKYELEQLEKLLLKYKNGNNK
jgi:hypothetical protein